MQLKKDFSWPISKDLLFSILRDELTDRFVSELIWERLFYIKEIHSCNWKFSNNTPNYWSEKFNYAPQVIAERDASIHLTRSIHQKYKQGLKRFLNFEGYQIHELYPRRTRRATAVNWLIFWSKESNLHISKKGSMPSLTSPPENPVFGHENDLPIT